MTVSILVVMDFLFQEDAGFEFRGFAVRFNPCCDGFPISRVRMEMAAIPVEGFNPCCDGFPISSLVQIAEVSARVRFQSLL